MGVSQQNNQVLKKKYMILFGNPRDRCTILLKEPRKYILECFQFVAVQIPEELSFRSVMFSWENLVVYLVFKNNLLNVVYQSPPWSRVGVFQEVHVNFILRLCELPSSKSLFQISSALAQCAHCFYRLFNCILYELSVWYIETIGNEKFRTRTDLYEAKGWII